MNWNKVKQDIDSHQSEVDVADLWAAIKPDVDALNKRRKRRFLWFWFFGLLLVGLGGFGLFYAWNSNDDAVIGSKKQLSEKMIVSELKEEEEICDEIEKEKTEVITNTISNQNLEEKVKQKGINKSSKQVNKTTYVEQNSINKEISESASINTSTSILGVGNTSLTDAQIIESTTEWSLPKSILPISTLASNLDFSLETKLPIQENVDVLMDSIFEQNKEILEDKLIKKEQPKSKLSIQAISGFSYAFKNLKTDNSELLNLKKSTETSLETSHFGVHVTYKNKKDWLFTSGLQRSSINERFDYLTTSVEEELINDGQAVIAYAVNYHQDTTFVMGESFLLRTTTHTRKYYNSYQMLEIPLLVGKEKAFGAWTFGAQAGLFVNLSLKTKGRAFANFEEIVDLKTNQESLFKSNVKASIYAGTFVQRQLSEHWKLSFSVNSRYFLDDFANQESSISQRYFLVGGSLGLGYSF